MSKVFLSCDVCAWNLKQARDVIIRLREIATRPQKNGSHTHTHILILYITLHIVLHYTLNALNVAVVIGNI